MVLGGTGGERRVHEDIAKRCWWHEFVGYLCLTQSRQVTSRQLKKQRQKKNIRVRTYPCQIEKGRKRSVECTRGLRKGHFDIEGSRPEWCVSSMIYSRDTPFWLGTLNI